MGFTMNDPLDNAIEYFDSRIMSGEKLTPQEMEAYTQLLEIRNGREKIQAEERNAMERNIAAEKARQQMAEDRAKDRLWKIILEGAGLCLSAVFMIIGFIFETGHTYTFKTPDFVNKMLRLVRK